MPSLQNCTIPSTTRVPVCVRDAQSTTLTLHGTIVGMHQGVRNIFRNLQRKLAFKGFAKPVYLFMEEITSKEYPCLHTREGQYAINMSFDLELALNSYFWSDRFESALLYGEKARSNMYPIVKYLNSESVPHNVQIVGMLLEKEMGNSPLLSESQREVIHTNVDSFQITEGDQHLLTSKITELGLHGYSHRLFTSLTQSEADAEIKRAICAFEKRAFLYTPKPTFMSFPRNKTMHTELLKVNGITSWRSKTQKVSGVNEIPLGIWLSPEHLTPSIFKKILRGIKDKKRSFLLHMWSHFTEMTIDMFHPLIQTAKSEGWDFMNTRQLYE